MEKKIIFITSLLVLTGCQVATISMKSVEQEDALEPPVIEWVTDKYDDIGKYEDDEVDVTCWIYRGIYRAGMTCIPNHLLSK